MEHVVFFPAHDGSPAFRRVSTLEDAVRLVEHLRNVENVAELSVHSLSEVPLAFKTYFRVEVPAGEEAAAAEPVAEVAEAPVVPVLVEDIPVAEAPVVPVPVLVEDVPPPLPMLVPVPDPVAEVPTQATAPVEAPVAQDAEPDTAPDTAPEPAVSSLGFFAS